MMPRPRNGLLLFPLTTLAALMLLGRGGAQDAPADLARGRHVATALTGCAACHGANFSGGQPFTRGGQTVYAANLTGGAGGVAAVSDADLRRAIRTGIAPDGTRLRVMPSEEYAVMTDADVNDVIAFLRTLPPVDRIISRIAVSPPAGMPVRRDDAPPQTLTGGEYLATIGGCTGCHSANLAGGNRIGDVIAPNISHSGIGQWSFADFQTAMRTGKTPDGRTLSPSMPWQTVGKLTDDELRSVYDFLQSKPDQLH